MPIHPPHIASIIAAFERVPHCRELGITVVELYQGHGLMYVPYHTKLIGNPHTGALHGGVITSLLDTVGAVVVMASVPASTPLATLDLRIDYLRPAAAGRDIFASAECHKVTAHVAFVRGLAYQETFRDPVAHCTSTYMLGGSGFNPPASTETTNGGQPC
ncbi:MAG: PaaI family thioesterase [Gammaproteobacteria bacterium]